MSSVLGEHLRYVSDAARLAAFERALKQIVRRDDVVLDLGCGTGVLGLLACRAGASRVYAVDAGPMIDVARTVARANQGGERIIHLHAPSSRVVLPERATVLVSDQIGRMGFDAGIAADYADAHRRLLARGARVLPRRIRTWIAPVEAPAWYRPIRAWATRRAGLTLGEVCRIAENSVHPATFRGSQLLAAGRAALTLTLDTPARCRIPLLSAARTYVITRRGTLHGLAGWFTADLSTRVTMTNAPGALVRIQRRQAFLPVPHPVRVMAGDRVHVRLDARPGDQLIRWKVRVLRRGREIAQADQCTLRGLLPGLAPESRLKKRPAKG